MESNSKRELNQNVDIFGIKDYVFHSFSTEY